MISGGDDVINLKKVGTGGDGHLGASTKRLGLLRTRPKELSSLEALPIATTGRAPARALGVGGAYGPHAMVGKSMAKTA